MKKIRSIVFAALALFFMAGCNGTTDEVLPNLSLVGESIMEVEQYSEFVDPGVDILGDFDLDVVIDEDVDTSIIGDYIVTYTITYLEIDYSVSRTVRVVELGTVITPGIQLVGGNTIEVEQYSEFLDPGVTIIGDFDLDVKVVDDIDTSVLGSYTITYTITYLEIDYVVSRTVNVIEPITIIVPTITLIGDAEMQVEQNTDFVDPGVLVTGDLDLDVVVVSNIDTNTEGFYTITYTITYMEIDYSVSRSVEVVFELVVIIPDLFTITLDGDVVTGSSISVVVTVDDSNGVINNGAVELYNGDTYVNSFSFSNGVNNITFNDLDDETTYTVKVTGDYQDSNNKLTYLYGYVLDLTTLSVGELSFEVSELVVTTNSINFSIIVTDEDDKLTDLNIQILHGDTVIETIELFNELIVGETENSFAWVNFDGLTEFTDYTIQILHSYLPVGESMETDGDMITLYYTTLESVTPDVISHEVNERYYSLEGEIDLDYSDYESYYIWAKLYKDNVFVKSVILSDNYTTYEFDYLDGNTEYRIDIYGDFMITSTGSIYETVLIDTLTVKTLEQGVLTPPTIENAVITHTSNTITIEFDVIDDDLAMERGIIYLYRGSSSYGNFDYIVGHNIITFESSIYENTLYTINIKADYTGNGSYVSIFEENVYIPPVITVDNFEQEDFFYSGDRVIMLLELDNDEDASITAVTINGERFSTFIFPSDSETLYVDLGVKTTGSYPINLQNIIITFNEAEYIIEATENSNITVYLPGSTAPNNADVVVIDIVPQDNYVTVDRDNPGTMSDVLVDVYLENNYNLTVVGIKIGGIDYYENDITIISSTHIQITAQIAFNSSIDSSNNLYYTNITFERNLDVIIGTSGSHVNAYIYEIYDFDNDDSMSDDIVHVSTPEDLLAINTDTANPSTVYILDNDIDMSGYDWTPIGTYADKFSGAFNGNGHTIYNVTITETFTESSELSYVGFFGYSTAFITDLTLDNINITVHSDVNKYLYIGTVAGKSTFDLVNVHVINSSITVDGVIKSTIGGLVGNQNGDIIRSSSDAVITNVTFTSETTNERLYVGGLVGIQAYDDIRHSSASGNITITISNSQTIFIGGLAGTTTDASIMVSNSYATGNIDVTTDYYSRVGGLIGNSYTATVDNSYASGDVHSSSGKIGGLIGESDGNVYSSFATGTVRCDSGTVGKIFGSGNTYKFDKMYTYDGQLAYNGDNETVGSDYYYTYLGEASAEEFNQTNYYTDFLGWSNHFYDFSTLDIENSNLPTH